MEHLENMKVVLSKKFSLMGRDYLRGLFMAMGTAALMVIQTSIDDGSLVFKWKQTCMAAVAAGLWYLFKNGIVEPTKTIITPVPEAKAEKVQEVVSETLNVNQDENI